MIDFDIVSTFGEMPKKFIRELHRVATYVKTMLFPIRGKIINAFKASKQAFFSNEEVQGITRIIFGQDYRKGLTIEDAKVEKIIFMSDEQSRPKMLFV